jgi:phage tail sheath protein FI
MVVTASTGVADSSLWMSASYVRDGNIVTNETTKTRKLATTDLTQANRRYAKFTFFLQGGFDGVNIFDRNEYNINDTAVKADMDDSNRGQNLGPNVRSYTKAIDIMKNTTNVDIQVLAIPGIRNPAVTDYATAATTERFDALYLMDVEHCDDNGNIIAADSSTQVSVKKIADNFSSRALDSNFAAAYFPDVTLTDPNTNTNLVVPPSAVVLGALALNDKLGHPWFAPAGFTRGALVSTLEAKVKLSKSNMDDLYDVNINPLVAFPGNSSPTGNPAGGVVIWGQKTLQAAASALDRVNVRRLMIDLRRQVRDIAQTIMFEPSREATLAKFSSAVKPKLDRIQALAGIDKYKIMIDTSTTTKTDIENNTLRGKIIVKPVKALEYVSLDFVVQNGAAQI